MRIETAFKAFGQGKGFYKKTYNFGLFKLKFGLLKPEDFFYKESESILVYYEPSDRSNERFVKFNKNKYKELKRFIQIDDYIDFENKITTSNVNHNYIFIGSFQCAVSPVWIQTAPVRLEEKITN